LIYHSPPVIPPGHILLYNEYGQSITKPIEKIIRYIKSNKIPNPKLENQMRERFPSYFEKITYLDKINKILNKLITPEESNQLLQEKIENERKMFHINYLAKSNYTDEQKKMLWIKLVNQVKKEHEQNIRDLNTEYKKRNFLMKYGYRNDIRDKLIHAEEEKERHDKIQMEKDDNRNKLQQLREKMVQRRINDLA
jgi:hypothetical protein